MWMRSVVSRIVIAATEECLGTCRKAFVVSTLFVGLLAIVGCETVTKSFFCPVWTLSFSFCSVNKW